MHRLMAVKQREVEELNKKISSMKLEVDAIKEEKMFVELELETLKEERDLVQKQIAAKLLELDNLNHPQYDSNDQQYSTCSSLSICQTAHKAFIFSNSSLSDCTQLRHVESEGGLSSFLSNSMYHDLMPSVEALEAAVSAANPHAGNLTEGKAASEVLMIVYQEDFQMSSEFWTKLVRILAHHKLWPDVEMLIGIANEQHKDFSPPVEVLEAMVLRSLQGGRSTEKKLQKLKCLLGNGADHALRHMSVGVKGSVRNILLVSRINDNELYHWLASFTNYS